MSLQKLYYLLKPYIPRPLQLALRRKFAAVKRVKYSHIWPVDPNSGSPPNFFKGWPDGKKFALVLTHDVDTAKGQDNCKALMNLEMRTGFRSSFNFVPERYQVSAKLRETLTSCGFEVGVHGLLHDGKLLNSRKIFLQRAERINQYLKEWKALGFRSPAMHHNLEWFLDLDIEYDASTFDTDPFEPQSDGVKTIFPFWVADSSRKKGYVELPYTLPQDHALFIILKEKDISIWKQKLDWIASKGGMALLNTHPDYMNFESKKDGREEYPADLYLDFLDYVSSKYKNKYWHALPKEIAKYWRQVYCRLKPLT